MDAHAETPNRGGNRLAWALGLAGAVACVGAAGLTIGLGFTDELAAVVLGYLFGALMGVLGALVAMREPRNPVGWLMCVAAIATSLINLPADYGYLAIVAGLGKWPLGREALWLSGWSWVVVVGIALPLISVRFPDGRVTPVGRAAERTAVAGAALFVLGHALSRHIEPPLPARVLDLLGFSTLNPFGGSVADGTLAELDMIGLPLILVGYLLVAAAVIGRFRQAAHEERTQVKWFVSAGLLVAAAAVGGGAASILADVPLSRALVPFDLVLVALPIAVAVAILRYRLYDIDLLINRTLVYGGSTAILGALYVAVITFLQRAFVSVSGQRSDGAAVIAAFVVVAAFGPMKDWLQGRVDRRFGRTSPVVALDQLRAEVELIVSVLDRPRVACTLLDRAMSAFDARSAALYLEADGASPYRRGRADDEPCVEVPLAYGGRTLGRLVLGTRRGRAPYSERDRIALQESADTVSEALVLAALRPSDVLAGAA